MGSTPAENPYVLFQWLDDDRFAVMPGAMAAGVADHVWTLTEIAGLLD